MISRLHCFCFSYYTHQTLSNVSYLSMFLICIDSFNLCLEKERQQGRDRPEADLGLKKMLMDIKIDLSYCFYLLSINALCLKRIKRTLKRKLSPQFSQSISSPEDSNLKPLKLHRGALRELTELLSEALRMYGQARRREMHRASQN